MKTRLNKAASPNRRPRSPFAMSHKFDYLFCAPPSLSAAVGEPQRWPLRAMRPSRPTQIAALCLAGLATGSVVIFLVHDMTRKPSLRVGATWQEYDAYIHSQEVTARRRRLPPRKGFIALQGRPWEQTTVTRYYF